MPGNTLTMTGATYDTSAQKFGTGALNGGYGQTAGALFSGPPFTLEGWVKLASNPGAIKVAFGATNMAWVGIDSAGHAEAIVGYGGSPAQITTTKSLTDSAWHHVVLAVAANGTSVLYVDGTSVGTGATPSQTSFADKMGVGCYGTTAGYTWTGEIDEVALWSTQQYTGNFTPPSTAYTGNEGMIALYHLDSNGTDSSAPSGVTVNLPQSNIFFPAQGWDLSNSAHAITNSSGNYLKASFANSASCTLSLLINYSTFGSTADGEKIVLTWSIDNGAPQQMALTTANAGTGVVQLSNSLAFGTHTLQIWVRGSSPFINHWNPGADRNFLDITGLSTSAGTLSFSANSNQLPGMLLAYGDSMTEGEGTEAFVSSASHAGYATNDDATHSYVPHLAAALNCEYAVAAFGCQGWTSSGADGVTPGLSTSWNLQYSGKSRSFSGLTYVTINMGTNGNTIGSAGTVSTFLTSLRAACGGSTKIIVFIPWSGAARSALLADFSTYQGGGYSSATVDTATIYRGSADANTVLIDLGAQAAIGLSLPATTNSAGSLFSYDTVHETAYGNMRIAAMAAKAVQAAFSAASAGASHSFY